MMRKRDLRRLRLQARQRQYRPADDLDAGIQWPTEALPHGSDTGELPRGKRSDCLPPGDTSSADSVHGDVP